MNEAWSAVQLVGSPAAVRGATDLLDACADLLGVATQFGEARGKMAAAFKGVAWTAEQDDALAEARDRVVKTRAAFIRAARTELGIEVIDEVPEQLADVAEAVPPSREHSELLAERARPRADWGPRDRRGRIRGRTAAALDETEHSPAGPDARRSERPERFGAPAAAASRNGSATGRVALRQPANEAARWSSDTGAAAF